MMPDERMGALMTRFFQGTITAEEKEELAEWIEDTESPEELKALLGEAWMEFTPPGTLPMERAEAILTRVLQKARVVRVPLYRRLSFQVAAVAMLLLLGVAALLWKWPGKVPSKVISVVRVKDVAPPTGSHAVLTLANGRQIVLDSAGSGRLADQAGAEVSKVDSGRLTYNPVSASNLGDGSIPYNTLSIGRGGFTMVRLSDGTKVWLSSISSLRYPVIFREKDRTVYMTGEGYFEVARDVNRPFHVVFSGPGDKECRVEVLGTHFNIMAYPDEGFVTTTLLEGAVRVTNGGRMVRLVPGQQARISADGVPRVEGDIDPIPVTAWKDGLFYFDGAPIQVIMRELSRWYDVEVSYQGAPPADLFTAIIRKDNSISQVLRIMEQTKRVHFIIDHKKITVMP